MLNNKPSLGFFTVSPSPSFFTVLKFNLAVIAIGLLMCVNAFATNSLVGEVYNENTTATSPANYIRDAYVCAYGSPTVCAYTTLGGVYFLENLGSGAYDVCVTKADQEDVNHITSADVTRIQQAVAGTLPFPTDELKWAADVSGNGTVSSTDAAYVSNWLIPQNPFGNTGKWRFWPEGASVPWPSSDASSCKHYDSISGTMADENWDGILKGEVTLDWVCPVPTRCNL